MGRILYTDEAIKRAAKATTLLRTQVEQLAEAPLIPDGRGLRAAVSAGDVLISVGLTEDCQPDGDWRALSVGGYHVMGRATSPETAVVRMLALEDRIHDVLVAIVNSRGEPRVPREDLLYERVVDGCVEVETPYASRQYAGTVEVGDDLCCEVYGARREQIVAALEAAGLPTIETGAAL